MIGKIINFYWGRGLHFATPMLAFYLIVSLAPLVFGLAAIAGIIFAGSLTPTEVASALSERFPERVREIIIDLAGSVRNRPSAVFLSVVAMSWTFSSALMVIEQVMSKGEQEPLRMILGRLRLVLFGLFFALLLLVAIAAGSSVSGYVPVGGSLEALLGFFVIFIGITLLYKTLPRERPGLKRAALGAIPASIGLFFTPSILTIYLSFGQLSWGGIFAAVLIILLSCYLISLALVVGAAIAAEKKGFGGNLQIK